MKEKTLLILAAGMGSRFGGLKQIEPFGPNGEFIIDYSIYDARKAGFNKVVFVIKEENYNIFKETIGKRIEPFIKTEYAFQDNRLVPKEYQELLQNREKPLGTAHAILCAKDKIHGSFAMINADDFYGRDALEKASSYLDNVSNNHYGMIAYLVKNTLSPSGASSRGICYEENGKLTEVVESKVERIDNKIIAVLQDTKEKIEVSENTPVSMNLLLFSNDFFSILEEYFYLFLEQNKNDLSKVEYQIPTALSKAMKYEGKTVDLMITTAKWYGVTYKEDQEMVKKAFIEMTEEKKYPQNLWKD